MKKLFVSLMLLISIVSFATPPASGDKVAPQLKAALEKEFAGAQYVVWQSLKKHQLYHAKFIYNNEQVNAFFEQDGNLVAIGRHIATSALPLTVTKSLQANYAGFRLVEAMEYVRSGETSYVVSLENDKSRMVMEAYPSGNLYLFKKEKKNLPGKL